MQHRVHPAGNGRNAARRGRLGERLHHAEFREGYRKQERIGVGTANRPEAVILGEPQKPGPCEPLPFMRPLRMAAAQQVGGSGPITLTAGAVPVAQVLPGAKLTVPVTIDLSGAVATNIA